MQHGSGLRVLVVEDDPAIGRALDRALRRAGHVVVLAHRCVTARAVKERVDIAVLDLELPDGSGVEVAGELLRVGSAGRVVFFSAANDPALLREAATLGEVVTKDEALHRLLEAVAAS
jgi:two-component system catabolic regulation response regulator CreB